jgi:hypothetical protein
VVKFGLVLTEFGNRLFQSVPRLPLWRCRRRQQFGRRLQVLPNRVLIQGDAQFYQVGGDFWDNAAAARSGIIAMAPDSQSDDKLSQTFGLANSYWFVARTGIQLGLNPSDLPL